MKTGRKPATKFASDVRALAVAPGRSPYPWLGGQSGLVEFVAGTVYRFVDFDDTPGGTLYDIVSVAGDTYRVAALDPSRGLVV